MRYEKFQLQNKNNLKFFNPGAPGSLKFEFKEKAYI